MFLCTVIPPSLPVLVILCSSHSKHPSGVQTNLQQAVSSVGDLPLPVLSAKPNVSPTGSVHGDLPLPVFGQI